MSRGLDGPRKKREENRASGDLSMSMSMEGRLVHTDAANWTSRARVVGSRTNLRRTIVHHPCECLCNLRVCCVIKSQAGHT